MKVFISADIEGVAGCTLPEETHMDRPEYQKFAEQMTREVLAACEGATAAGATEIVIKDGHGTASNIDILRMPKNVTLIRGKSGHPYNMMYGLDRSFDAVMYIGYHSGAGQPGNPISHTSTGNAAWIKINGMYASEFMINSYAAAVEQVPVVFLSADEALCDTAKQFCPGITTVATKRGVGGATHNLAPEAAIARIRENTEKALRGDLSKCLIPLPKTFEDIICFKDHKRAYKMSYYPGMELVDARTIRMVTTDFMDIETAHMFVLY